MRFNRLNIAFLVVAAAAMPACDFKDPLENVDIRLDIEDAPIQFSGNEGTVTVSTEQANITTANVSMDSDIEEVEDLKVVRLKAEDFSFTPSAGAQASNGFMSLVQASGQLQLGLLVSGLPVPGFPVTLTIVNNVVTDVSPDEINFSNVVYQKDQIEAMINALPASQRPNLPSNWDNLTVAQAKQLIEDELGKAGFDISIVVNVISGDLNGSLTLGEFSVDAEVVTGN